MNDTLRRIFKSIAKRDSYYKRDKLANRAALKQRIEEEAQDGLVTVVQAGTDCDGYRYRHSSNIPALVMAYVRHENNIYDWADGPVSVYLETE